MPRLTELLLCISSLMVVDVSSLRCEKTPEGVSGPPSPSEDYFSIDISANPSEYTPGEQYTITVRAKDEHRIRDFLLVVEHDTSKKPIGEIYTYAVGTFQLRNMLTKFSDKCPNAVTNTNVIPKTEIEVYWRAPDAGNGCVAFKVIIVESRDLWYNEGDALTKRFCEEEKRNGDFQPHVLRQCCACDEAKYEVTFEGLWSRNTHPKDFPSDKWRTRFSDVIGASHTVDYSFWNYGDMASEGLREVAENASTRTLESELKAKSDHIRTIIKARGIGYPNVTGKTFAVFRVDKRHHLMSLVSMIFPSPDWFVGVSSLELCLENCSWVESMVLRLYPNDAGTDDGLTYDAPEEPTYPRGVIRKITSDSPNDERSPFYDGQGLPIKPLAKLYLSRQRLYEKTCSSYEYTDETDENCEVTEWSEWTPCSVSCGKGIKYRQRRYRHEGNHYNCRMRLTERASCRGSQKYCREDPNTSEGFEDPRCQLTEWGEWSSCSVSCGVGTKTRSRRYKNRSAAKRCAVGQENPPILEQNLECYGESSDCEGMEEILANIDCPERPWTMWSPCSVTCGKGVKVRYRLSSMEEGDQQKFLMRQSRAHINLYDDEAFQEGEEDEEEKKSEDDACANVKPVELVECIADEAPSCDEIAYTEPATDSPSIPPYIQSASHSIDENNDITEEPAMDVRNCKVSQWSEWSRCNITGPCGRGYKEKYREIIEPEMNGGKPCPQIHKTKKCKIKCKPGQDSSKYDPNPTWGPPRLPGLQENNCEMSEWSAWSPCSQSCGPEAVQQRTRKIIRRVSGKGEPCSYRIDQKSCQLLACPLR